jgi:predicted aldo/keto reductase-like oxidoreductase
MSAETANPRKLPHENATETAAPNGRAEMETIEIGGPDITASRIALGTWAIGGWMWGGSDVRSAFHTVQAAIDHGVNLIDTAPA